MAGIAAAILGAGAIGAGASIFGSMTQANAAKQGIAAEQGMFNTALQQQQPFVTAGAGAANTLSDLLKPGADMSSLLKTIPGFKFLQDITQQGVSNQGTVTGLGGNTLLAGANAGNNIALSAGWLPIVNSLQGLVNSGASAAGNIGQQAVQTGGNIAGSTMNVGNAIAGGVTGAAGNIGNSLTTATLFNKLLNNSNMYGPQNISTGNPGGTGNFLG